MHTSYIRCKKPASVIEGACEIISLSQEGRSRLTQVCQQRTNRICGSARTQILIQCGLAGAAISVM